jgi:hypothetical protein
LKAQARQIAEINPDIVDGISSDATHVIHDAQHDLPTLLFVTSRSYIATYPNVIIGSVPPRYRFDVPCSSTTTCTKKRGAPVASLCRQSQLQSPVSADHSISR